MRREKWEATRQKRVDERQRLKRIEQEDLRRRMEDLRRRIDSLLMEANNVLSQLLSEQMKREAKETPQTNRARGSPQENVRSEEDNRFSFNGGK